MGVSLELTDPEFLADPYATYESLRDHGPVWRHPNGMVFVTRHAEACDVLKSPDRFSSRAMILPGQEGDGAGSLIGQDPPVHTLQRNVVNRGFTPRRIAALERRVRARVEALLSAFEGEPELELVEQLAAPLPVMVIAELLGLDPSRHGDFKRWSDATIVGSTVGDAGSSLAAALDEMYAHLEDVIVARRRQPEEDLISALVHAEEQDGVLTPKEVLHFTQLLLAAGSETTTNLLGNAVLALLAHPEQYQQVLEDLSLVPQLVEETLRWDSPVQLVMRRANGPLSFCGEELAYDETVMVLLASANRDDRAFPDAARFDIHRSAQGHLSFGLGNHFCLGSALARLQAKVALEMLLRSRGALEPVPQTAVEHHGSFLVRGPKALLLRAAA